MMMARTSPFCIVSGVTPVSACHGFTNAIGENQTLPTASRSTAATMTPSQLMFGISDHLVPLARSRVRNREVTLPPQFPQSLMLGSLG